MNWIFQAIPKKYDLKSKMREGDTVTWLVTRYRDKMSKSDIVFLWSAGPEDRRGVYGWGRIVEDNPKYYDDWGYGVKVHYEKVFGNHLPSESIGELPEFADHILFKVAAGTNFEIDEKQTTALIDLILKEYGDDMIPHEESQQTGMGV